jgi:spore maturation protein CgeB
LLFIAGWRPGGRRILEDLLPTERRLTVYGGRWTAERIDPAYLGGAAIRNPDLAAYYGAASIVLNDHWAGMRREGFLSNRLYDASAAGAFVITDEVDGLEAEFDGGVVGYRDRRHLHDLIEHYLEHPAVRRVRSERARAAVLERHTFAHRARTFIDAVTPLLRDRGGDTA